MKIIIMKMMKVMRMMKVMKMMKMMKMMKVMKMIKIKILFRTINDMNEEGFKMLNLYIGFCSLL